MQSVISGEPIMSAKVIFYLAIATAFAFSDFALARDLGNQRRGGYNLRSTPTIKVPRTRAVPKNVVPVYPGLTSSGIDRRTIGLEYNWQLREGATSMPRYIPLR